MKDFHEVTTYRGEARAEGTNKNGERGLGSSNTGNPSLPLGQKWEGEMLQKGSVMSGSAEAGFCSQELYRPGRDAATARDPVPRRAGVGKKHPNIFSHPLISGACQVSSKGSQVGCLQGSASRAQSRAVKGGEFLGRRQLENSQHTGKASGASFAK